MTTTPTPRIAAAIVAAQAQVKRVAKGDRNQHHGFDYASAEDIIAAGRAAMESTGLALIVHRTYIRQGIGDLAEVVLVGLLVHAESDERIRVRTSLPIIPGKGRPEDRATLGARTSALAYLIRDLLLLDRGEDIDSRDDRDHDPAERRRQAEQRPARPEPAAPPAKLGVVGYERLMARLKANGRSLTELRDALPFEVGPDPSEWPMEAAKRVAAWMDEQAAGIASAKPSPAPRPSAATLGSAGELAVRTLLRDAGRDLDDLTSSLCERELLPHPSPPLAEWPAALMDDIKTFVEVGEVAF